MIAANLWPSWCLVGLTSNNDFEMHCWKGALLGPHQASTGRACQSCSRRASWRSGTLQRSDPVEKWSSWKCGHAATGVIVLLLQPLLSSICRNMKSARCRRAHKQHKGQRKGLISASPRWHEPEPIHKHTIINHSTANQFTNDCKLVSTFVIPNTSGSGMVWAHWKDASTWIRRGGGHAGGRGTTTVCSHTSISGSVPEPSTDFHSTLFNTASWCYWFMLQTSESSKTHCNFTSTNIFSTGCHQT